MTPAEMHAIEKAALEDPFLADAIEGYQASLPSSSDLQELKERLDTRTLPAKLVPMTPRPWLSMAAAVVVLLGMAYTMWVTLDSPSQPAIAKTRTPEIIREDISLEDTLDEPEPPPPPPPVAIREKVPVAKAKAGDPQPATSQPAAPAAEPPVVTGYATKPADEAKASEITINKEEETKRLRAAPMAAPKAASADKAKRDEAGPRIYTEPADGWSAFEVYVLNNLRRPKDPVLHGNVVLSFQVNPETGKPYDIKVDKPLHPLYDKEAIRLLKEGPGWAVYNTDAPVKTTYTVVF